ncbi:MAG: hypothetical protein ACYDCC_04410 [Actinomycetota bacterium]
MKKLVMVAALAGLVASMAIPANAAGSPVWVGSVETACTVRLDNFPSPSIIHNSADCDNDLGSGTTAGSVPDAAIDFAVGGISTPNGNWIAGGTSGNNVGATRSTVFYNENCSAVPSGTFPDFGTSAGNFVIAGQMDSGRPLSLLAGYDWTRTGLVATITFHATHGGYLDTGQYIPNNVEGLASVSGSTFSMVQSTPPGTTASSVGLLEPQAGSTGQNNNCPSSSSHNWEVVTAYAIGGFLN